MSLSLHQNHRRTLHDSYILLIAIIGLLVVIVAVLLWANLRYQRKLSDKDIMIKI